MEHEFLRGNLIEADRLAKLYKGKAPIKEEILNRMEEIRDWNKNGKPACYTGRLPFEYFPKHIKALSLVNNYFSTTVGKLKMLDVGCFMGYWVLYMRRLGHHALGCDIQIELMDGMGKKFGGFAYANAEKLEESYSMTFDVITMFDSIEHCLDDKAAVESAKGLLNPGGILIIHVPLNELYEDNCKEHMRIYNEDNLKELIPDIILEPCIDEKGRSTMMGIWIKPRS